MFVRLMNCYPRFCIPKTLVTMQQLSSLGDNTWAKVSSARPHPRLHSHCVLRCGTRQLGPLWVDVVQDTVQVFRLSLQDDGTAFNLSCKNSSDPRQHVHDVCSKTLRNQVLLFRSFAIFER